MLRTSDQALGLRSARELPPSDTPRVGRPHRLATRTIAVTSGKGGVGKTQLSANLAVAMAGRGLRVALLDADLGLASLDLALGVRPGTDLVAVMRGDVELDEILVDVCPGLKLIPACPGRYEMANMSTCDRMRLLNLIDGIAGRFDAIVIDTGAGIGSNAVGFASVADDVLLVTTQDPTSLRDAYAMAKVLYRRTGVEQIQVISNQVGSEHDGLAVYERLEGIVRKFLGLDLNYLGAVPSDPWVGRAVLSGQPYILGAPSSVAARATERVAGRLCDLSRPEELC
ncbi:MAG: MinD/ParA family protein [Myxococcales bacterium]|nr:MinD/ParA family protein [Myxococcales bacterium]